MNDIERALERLAEIEERHDAILPIDWRKEFDPEVQPQSLSNAHQSHRDRAFLLDIAADALRVCEAAREFTNANQCVRDTLAVLDAKLAEVMP